jgi:FkbM family methyltransferase
MASDATPDMRPVKRDRLIIDAGMHTGEDTAFYLAKGFDVVGIEANPALAAEAAERFAGPIAEGRLRIVNAAIAERSGRVPLAVADDATIWSSLSDEFIRRNESAGTRYRTVEVPAVTFEEVLDDVGIPHYLKIDIEGLDMLCVRALREFDERPAFVSLESHVSIAAASFERVFDELAELFSLGYRRFQYVNQRRHPSVRLPATPREGAAVDARFTVDSSGPFGKEAPGRWMPIAATLPRAYAIWGHHQMAGYGGRWSGTRPARAYRRSREALRRRVGWYDLHAGLE